MGILDGGEEHRERFVRTFCESQQLARRLAQEFNKKLSHLHRVDNSTPRVTFLDCSVYELNDKNKGKQSVLVEEKIDHLAWHKWNMNNGYIEGEKDKAIRNDNCNFAGLSNLGVIEEGDEEEE